MLDLFQYTVYGGLHFGILLHAIPLRNLEHELRADMHQLLFGFPPGLEIHGRQSVHQGLKFLLQIIRYLESVLERFQRQHLLWAM